jgi:hypothetical protein
MRAGMKADRSHYKRNNNIATAATETTNHNGFTLSYHVDQGIEIEYKGGFWNKNRR